MYDSLMAFLMLFLRHRIFNLLLLVQNIKDCRHRYEELKARKQIESSKCILKYIRLNQCHFS